MHAASLSPHDSRKLGSRLCECAQQYRSLRFCTFAEIFASDVRSGLCFIFPSCYSVTADRVAMATAILKRVKLSPNSGLKKNRREKQVSLYTLLVS